MCGTILFLSDYQTELEFLFQFTFELLNKLEMLVVTES